MRIPAHRLVRVTLLLCLATTGIQAQPADTTGFSKAPLFTGKDAWIAAGFTVGVVAMFPLDRYWAERLQTPGTQSNSFLRHQATNVRLVAEHARWIGGGMYLVGKLTGTEKLADLGLHGTEALFVGSAVTGLIKGLAGRSRPYNGIDRPHEFDFAGGFDSNDFRSFPSGHALAGFAAAAAVTSETARWWPQTSPWIGIAMYGGASLVGLSRMYNNKHWSSDVLMGAAIGTFAGRKIVHYHHSHPNNRIDRWLLGSRLIPAPDGGAVLAVTLTPPRRNASEVR